MNMWTYSVWESLSPFRTICTEGRTDVKIGVDEEEPIMGDVYPRNSGSEYRKGLGGETEEEKVTQCRISNRGRLFGRVQSSPSLLVEDGGHIETVSSLQRKINRKG